MTRERYESISLHDLREIAKNRGMRRISTLKKADLIDVMLEKDEEEARVLREEKFQRRQEKKLAMEAAQGSAAAGPSDTAEMMSGLQNQPGAADGLRSSERAAVQENQEAVSAQGQPGGSAGQTSSRAAGPGRFENSRQREQRRQAGAFNGNINNGNSFNGSGLNGNGSGVSGFYGGGRRQKYMSRGDERQAGKDARDFQQVQAVASGEPETGQKGKEAVIRESSGEYSFQTKNGGQQEGAASRPARQYQPGRPDVPNLRRDELNAGLDSGLLANGILEVMQDGFGFIRCANYMPGENDIYVAPSQIRRFGLKTGDVIVGNIRVKTQSEKFSALLFVKSVNGFSPDEATRRYNFEDMTPVFPNERIRLERAGGTLSMRIMDLMSPVGKGQRGMIVSPPKAGKTTLIKDIARSVQVNNPEIHLIVLLIDERPEEVTDIREAIEGPDAEVIYSTFDELPEHHKRVSEMAIERARRLVEHKKDVMILLDSITRLTRAYNITEPSSGRTLSGGLDPAALHMPKRFFGAARNMREGGSLTILATGLIETGSKMDDIVFEEFKGTGNMEIVLDRRLSERRIFPAIDIARSGTRRDDLLLTPDELSTINTMRRSFSGLNAEQAVTQALDLFSKTRSNGEFISMARKVQWGSLGNRDMTGDRSQELRAGNS